MLSVETMKWRLERMKGRTFPLVQWPGTARVLDVTETSLDLLVGGVRADYTWDRVRITQQRLMQNHELSIAELGGQHDANSAILAIHSGAGGVEAQGWAEMLQRMYSHWAENHKYNQEILERIQATLSKETETDARAAEQEWQSATAGYKVRAA